MIAAARPVAAPPGRRYLTFAGGALAAVIAVLLAAGLLMGGSGPSVAERRAAEVGAFLTFERAVGELVEHGGAVVVYGMRPGVADIAEGRYADPVLRRMADGWLASFRELQAELAALDTPEPLEGAAAQLRAAFAAYAETAAVLLDAAEADGATRSALADRAVALGSDADDLYDQALAALAAHRARLGLPDHKDGP